MQLTNFYILLFAILTSCTIFTLTDARSRTKFPITLNEDTWTQLLQGEWMVDFYAPWCPACKKLEPEWQRFADWSDDLNINVASADVTTNPGLSGRFMVSGLPTIYHVKDGVFRAYSGPREHTALIKFIEEQGWKLIEPVSRWWAPDTLQMSFVAYSFRVSMTLRDVHNYLTDHVGLPYYVSYTIFALGTVTLGTVIGLIIVFTIDQLSPARYSSAAYDTRPSVARRKKDDDANDSDLDDTGVKGGDDKKESGSNSDRLRKRVNN